MPPKRRPLAERFWPKVDVRGADECWPFTGSLDKKGYGEIARGGHYGSPLKAHRVAWELTNGGIPNGLSVLHKCDNPPCCNPGHAFLGTVLDNNADMKAKGRQVNPPVHRGEKSGAAKLSGADVRIVRARFALGGIGCSALGRLFGLSKAPMHQILKRKTWVSAEYEPKEGLQWIGI